MPTKKGPLTVILSLLLVYKLLYDRTKEAVSFAVMLPLKIAEIVNKK